MGCRMSRFVEKDFSVESAARRSSPDSWEKSRDLNGLDFASDVESLRTNGSVEDYDRPDKISLDSVERFNLSAI